MNIKVKSTNNIIAVTLLSLFLLMSQIQFFKTFFTSPLGRALLIFLLIIISNLNRILGVFSVLLIIINGSMYSEGFEQQKTNIPKVNDKLKVTNKLKVDDISKLDDSNNGNKTSIEGSNHLDIDDSMRRSVNPKSIKVEPDVNFSTENVEPANPVDNKEGFTFF